MTKSALRITKVLATLKQTEQEMVQDLARIRQAIKVLEARVPLHKMTILQGLQFLLKEAPAGMPISELLAQLNAQGVKAKIRSLYITLHRHRHLFRKVDNKVQLQ